MTTIAYVEDHIGFRNILVKNLETIMGDCKIYVYDNGLDFTSRFPAQNYTPSIVLMDIRMPEMNGYETTKWIKKHHPTIPVMAFSDLEELRAMEAIIECGADGYTSKASWHLATAINQIIDGTGYYDDPELFHRVKDRMKQEVGKSKVGINAISAAEMRVLRTLPTDKTPIELAKQINMSVHTYNNHIKSIGDKLGKKTSKALMKLAHSLGLIEM